MDKQTIVDPRRITLPRTSRNEEISDFNRSRCRYKAISNSAVYATRKAEKATDEQKIFIYLYAI